MRISRERLLSEAEVTGFRPEVIEKIIHLLDLLQGFRSHPFLRERLALKGGTALNLFVLDLPRLSVDIDLNYVGAIDRKTMLAERPKVDQAIQAVCSREGFAIRRIPEEHAGGKWLLRYESGLGGGGNLEVDLNFMFRIPLWPVTARDSHAVGSYGASDIPTLDIHELAAGKMTALLSRRQARDLFDVHQILGHGGLERQRLRLVFVVYGAVNRRDWRTVSVEDVDFDPAELEHRLIPLLRRHYAAGLGQAATWGKRLVEECRDGLAVVLPLSETESEFLDRLLDQGEVEPSLLTANAALAERVGRHPLLEWQALNVRQRKGE